MDKRSSINRPKRPRDFAQLAKEIVEEATGQKPESPKEEAEPEPTEEERKRAAAILGRRGGLKGGKARAAKLTPEQRSEIAKRAAAARWSGKKL